MDRDEEVELRRLRERAYGPAADLELDPAAVARLHALEQSGRLPVVHAEPPALEVASPAEGPVATSEPAPRGDQVLTPASVRLQAALDRVRQQLRTRRGRLLALWVGSLIVGVMLAGAIMTAVGRVQAAPLTPTAEQIVRLEPVVPETPLPSVFTSPVQPSMTPISFGVYQGLAVVVSGGPWSGDLLHICISVYDAVHLRPIEGGAEGLGLYITGCAEGAFPAVAQWVVTTNDPKQFRAVVPVGDAVQFVYDAANNEVVVFRANGSTVLPSS